MRKLEIADYFWNQIKGAEYEAALIERLFNETFFELDNDDKKGYLRDLLNGLMMYDVPFEYIGDIFRQLMKLDGYSRSDKPAALPKGNIVLECTGSGKKPYKTLNLSTPSIITAVSAGARIIKKGSGATSSIIGSADLIYGLGYKKDISLEDSEILLEKTGFAFVDIEKVIPNFNELYNGLFYKPHLLSYVLAAQVTSLRGSKILYGLADKNVEKSCRTLKYLNSEEMITVYTSTEEGGFYFDELLGDGNGIACRCNGGVVSVSQLRLDLPSPKKVMAEKTKEKSIERVVALLKNHADNDYLKIVVYNAAFYLYESQTVNSIAEGVDKARECIMNNTAFNKLVEIIEVSGGKPSWQ